MPLEQHIQELEALVSRLMVENAELKAESTTLKARIARLEVHRSDSGNSIIPPSQQKVSGFFRNLDGAQTFAVIRSVIDTTIKNAQNVFQAPALMAKG